MNDTRYNAFWRRTGAALLDTMILIPICVVATLLLPILGCFAGVGYMIAMHATHGQTLGKMACGIIVLRADDEARFGWGRAIWREVGPQIVLFGVMIIAVVAFVVIARPVEGDEAAVLTALAWIVVSITLGWTVANVAAMAFNARRRTLVDLMGGTIVMKTAYYLAPSVSGSQYNGGILHVPPAPPYPGGLEPPHHAPEFR